MKIYILFIIFLILLPSYNLNASVLHLQKSQINISPPVERTKKNTKKKKHQKKMRKKKRGKKDKIFKNEQTRLTWEWIGAISLCLGILALLIVAIWLMVWLLASSLGDIVTYVALGLGLLLGVAIALIGWACIVVARVAKKTKKFKEEKRLKTEKKEKK